MIALDSVIAPLSIDMRDTVEMRIVPSVFFANHLAVRRGLVGADGHRSVQPDALDGTAQKGLGGRGIAPGRQPKVDQLAV